MKKSMIVILGCLMVLLASSSAHAELIEISAAATTDHSYELYYSTALDNSDGVLLLSGSNYVVGSADIDLDLSSQWYINVHATAQGSGECFISDIYGDTTFDDIFTNSTDWMVNTTGFGNSMVNATSFGVNQNPPQSGFSFIPGIGIGAEFIWSANAGDTDVYFTCALPTSGPAIPEPMTIYLLGAGLLTVSFSNKNRF